MARKPRDYDAELQALMAKAKKVKTQKTTQLGELVQIIGADALPIEALAGALIAALEQSKKQPEAIARWTERGQVFFQQGGGRRKGSAGEAGGMAPGGKRGTKQKPGDPAGGTAGNDGAAKAPGRAA